MLVLTQASVGGFFAAGIAHLAQWTEGTAGMDRGYRNFNFLALMGAMGVGGIGASLFHLGRPLHAWRAFLGVRRSWLSREIIAFSLFAKSVLLLLAAEAWPFPSLQPWAWGGVLLTGAVSLAASVMVYADTPREFWSLSRTAPRFAGTAVVLGAAAWAVFSPSAAAFMTVLAGAVGKLALEQATFRSPSEAMRRTAIVQTSALSRVFWFRWGTMAGGGLVLPLLAICIPALGAFLALPAFVLLLASELAERSLFFRSVAQPKMPGGLS
jgi:DMSO reductase anchor subunit